jgi:hypothetical protein
LLRTDRRDLDDEEIWRLYIPLTRVEAAGREEELTRSDAEVKPARLELRLSISPRA